MKGLLSATTLPPAPRPGRGVATPKEPVFGPLPRTKQPKPIGRFVATLLCRAVDGSSFPDDDSVPCLVVVVSEGTLA